MCVSVLDMLLSTVARWFSPVGSRGLELTTGCGKGETGGRAIEGRWRLIRPCFRVPHANSPGQGYVDLCQSRAKRWECSWYCRYAKCHRGFLAQKLIRGPSVHLRRRRRLRPFGCHNCCTTNVTTGPAGPLKWPSLEANQSGPQGVSCTGGSSLLRTK